MTSSLWPTPITQHLQPPSHTPTHALHIIHPRGNDDDGDSDGDDDGIDHKVWPPQCTLPPGCVFPALLVCTYPSECTPTLPHPSYPSTFPWSYTTPPPISMTSQSVTPTVIPSGSDSATSTTPEDYPPSPTMPISSSGTPGEIVPDNRGLSPGGLVGVIVGGVGGVLLLLLLLWLLRRGTFGSGTLFGFRYGDAQKAGWRGSAQEMRQKGKEGYRISVSAPPSEGSTLSVPFFAGSKPPSYSQVPFDSSSSSSLRKAPPLPPLSPPPWSTSSSAFDNAYAVSSISAHTRSHTRSASVSVSMSLSVSDNSTLVSEPASLRPPERNSSAGASASPLTRYLNAYHPTSIPLPWRPPSPGETVSTSMVSFDRPDGDDSERDPSEMASDDSRSEWGAETSESTQPLGRHPGRAG